MRTPLEVSFHQMEPSAALESRIREKAEKLDQCYDRIIGCRVVVEAPHSHQHQGRLFAVRIHIKVPEAELVVNKDQHDKHSHEDAYVALRDAFDAALRMLEEYARRQRGEVKLHVTERPERITEGNREEEV